MPPRPNYTRVIVADVIEKIRTGEYPPKSKLPSVSEMQTIYRCSTQPIKTALRELGWRGYTEGHPGKGTYVVENPPLTDD